MPKLVVCGTSGRMGSLIIKLAQESKTWTLTEQIEQSDVIIDFTAPAGTEKFIALASQFKKPIVIGTTGLDEGQQKKIEAAAKKIPIVFSANMSVGVNVLFKLIEMATAAFGQNYKIEISETHHVHKKDAPSGTAKTMGMIVEKILKQKPAIQSFREGEVVGDHTIVFGSEREHLTIIHRALDRSVFAEGALQAAKWVLNQKAGLYSMADVLGLVR